MELAMWQAVLFGNADYGNKRTNQAEALYAVGITECSDQHGQCVSHPRPLWVSLHGDEDEARKQASAIVGTWRNYGWVTDVQINHGSKRIDTVSKPLARFGDYFAPSERELAARARV